MLLGITEIDQVTFDQIEKCVAIVNLELDHDKLFEEMINLQSTFKEVNSYCESLSVQIQKYIGDQDVEKQIVDEKCDAENDDEQVLHKTSTQHHPKIRPDQLWALLIAK